MNRSGQIPSHWGIKMIGVMLACAFCSCSSYRQQVGVADDLVESTAGSAGGAAIDEQSQGRDYERYGIPPEGPESGVVPDRGTASNSGPADPEYPVARRTSDPDQVLSPFPPYQRIDVSGFGSGQFARDPKTGKIFRVP